MADTPRAPSVLHYGLQSTGADFLDFCDIAFEPNERPEDLFQRITSFTENNLLRANRSIQHHSQDITEDEKLTPSLENFIVLTWLRLIHPDLPKFIKQCYGTELRMHTLASIKPKICQALDSLLFEIQTSDNAQAFGAHPKPKPTDDWNHTSEFKDEPIDEDYEPTEHKEKFTKQKTTSKQTTSQKKKIRKRFTCTICDKDVSLLKTLTRHTIKIHKLHLCVTCDKHFNSEKELKIHTDSSHSTSFVCSDKLADNVAADGHMVKNNFQTILTCLICECKYESSETFDEHQINCKTRSGDTKDPECHTSYQCLTCKKELSASSLQRHLRIHTGQRPYVCEICGKAFSSSSNLQVHVHRHKGYKPHICSFCGHCFTARSALKHHLKTHTGERNYLCNICNKRFAHSQTLKRHINTHSDERPVKCTECDRDFKENYQLKRHMLSHTKEQKFACKVCGKRFGRRGNMKVHTRTHNGLKPYSCGRCGLSFTYTQTLHNHTLKCNMSHAVFPLLQPGPPFLPGPRIY